MSILTPSEATRAIDANTRRFHGLRDRDWYIGEVRVKIGLARGTEINNDFVESLAAWQQGHTAAWITRPLRADGNLGPRTEAHLGIQLPKMRRLVEILNRYYTSGNILFDSWGNDFRDNDRDGLIDEADEQVSDGSHLGRVYDGFQVGRPQLRRDRHGVEYDPAQTAGWSGNRTVQGIPAVVTPVSGQYRYYQCSDLISMAMIEARIIRQRGRTGDLVNSLLPPVAYVFRRSEDYPNEYVGGDYIANWDRAHGGHSAVIIAPGATAGGANAAQIIELPGPSTMTEEGYYRPNGIHAEAGRPAGVRGDIVRGTWPQFRRDFPREIQFLVRPVFSRLARR